MRKVGINIRPNITYGVDPFAEAAARAGFECFFTYGNDRDFISHMKEKGDSLGLFYEALHAPRDGINDLWLPGEKGDETAALLSQSVALAAEFGIPTVIMHISSKENCPHVTDIGLERFDSVVQFAAEKNIKIAVENQRKLGNIATVLEIYGKDSPVGFCWDIGHEKCFAHGREYMPFFGDRCILTHIHDNNCQYNIDEHLLPFDGQIDFRRTAELLHNSGYKGTLMLEIDLPHEGSDKYADLSLEQFTAKAYASINRLRIISDY